MRRLFPDPVEQITIEEAYGVRRPRPTGRPWLAVCMVASLDGSTVVDRRSSALSSPTDTAVLLGLRQAADMIMVGASTVRIEGYGKPSKPGQRVGVVSRQGRLDYDSELFTCGSGFMILPESAPEVPVESVRAGHLTVDLEAAVARLEADMVQVEGGSMLNAALAEADLIDELNLTMSPVISGGDGPRLTTGAIPVFNTMELAHVLEHDGYLFTRYVRRRT